MPRQQFSDLIAQIIIAFIVALMLSTLFGIWLKWFWLGWVLG